MLVASGFESMSDRKRTFGLEATLCGAVFGWSSSSTAVFGTDVPSTRRGRQLTQSGGPQNSMPTWREIAEPMASYGAGDGLSCGSGSTRLQ